MKILPAIDIKNGKIVRLIQGDYSRETIYDDSPVCVAKKWKNQGAKELHIVDLDGAREGCVVNLDVIRQIVKAIDLPVQVGGGIRSIESAKQLFKVGVRRIILSTIAVENQGLLQEFISLFRSKIIVSLDVKDNKLAKKGWLETSREKLIPTAQRLEKMGIKTIIYTDTIRDGMLSEPNYVNIAILRKMVKMKLLIAGSVSSIKQIAKLNSMGIDGVIIALYEGKINLKEVINYVN